MNGFSLENQKINKASKWTIFLLIDLRTVFIITYVFITVVSLISATANSEATRDAKSTSLFNVTLKYLNVNVSYISDAVLWNCRKLSVTKNYYKGLYWMLIGATGTLLVFFLIVKIGIVCCAKHGDTYLWHLAVMSHFHTRPSAKSINEIGILDAEQAEHCEEMLSLKSVSADEKIIISKRIRSTILLVSIVCLSLHLFLFSLSYDFHPLSCIFGPSDKHIYYNATSQTVTIWPSDQIVWSQRISVLIVACLSVIFIGSLGAFAIINYEIVKLLKSSAAKVQEELKDAKLKIETGTQTLNYDNKSEEQNQQHDF